MTYEQFVAKIVDEAYEDAKTRNDRSEVYRNQYYDNTPKDAPDDSFMYQESLYPIYVKAYQHALDKLNDNTGKILGHVDLSKFRKGNKMKKESGLTLVEVLVVLVIVAIIFALAAPFFGRKDREETAMNAIESMGFESPILQDNAAWYKCGKYDIYNYEFMALNPKNKWVKGVVCCGAHKGCTIRF